MKLQKILEGRPLGHPLHTLIAHLPLGLWLFAVVQDIVGFTHADAAWALEGAAWSLLIGTAVALVSVVTGFNDWLDIRKDHPAQNAALWHMGMMLPAVGIFIIDTLLHFSNRSPTRGANGQVTAVMMGLSIGGYVLAMVGGYLGGKLVYDDGISVGRHRRTAALPQNTIHEPRKGTTEQALAPHTGLGANYHPVIPESGVPEGHTVRMEILGHVIMVARANGKLHAVQEFCTHRCGPLSEGQVFGGQIRCPWHNSCFDLTTGKVTKGPATVDLKTYEVQVHHGIIHVNVQRDEPARDAAGTDGRTGGTAESTGEAGICAG